MEEIEFETIRERKRLAYGGAVSLVVTVDKTRHQLIGEPQITFQGVAGLDPLNGFMTDAREAIANAVHEMKPEQIADRTVFRENLRLHLKRIVQKDLSSKPVIITTVVEI
jgi:mRNA degradation ribonuclease J1/J2